MNTSKSKISNVLLSPFHTGSHKNFAEGLIKYSKHTWQTYSLPGKHWKWRMYGAAITFANRLQSEQAIFKNIIANDMLDLAVFKSLVNTEATIHLYFHENQLSYPWSPSDQDPKLQRDNHYSFKNYTSALAADKVWFNSHYHKSTFLTSLEDFLKKFPDAKNLESIDQIAEKSAVLHLGVELPEYTVKDFKHPIIIWNHRWEYDKNPTGFYNALTQLKKNKLDFKLIICGTHTHTYPKIFDTIKAEFKSQLIHFGTANSKADYYRLLAKANYSIVTSNQDFFGGSVVDLLANGIIPLLPNRLAYTEHIPESLQNLLFYDDDTNIVDKFKSVLTIENKVEISKCLSSYVSKYHWKNCIDTYDRAFH